MEKRSIKSKMVRIVNKNLYFLQKYHIISVLIIQLLRSYSISSISVKRLVLNHNNLKISGRYHHRRLLTNFESLEELHLTNAFTEVIDSKWYLDDLKDILLTAQMTKLYKLHLEQNEIW